MAIKVGFPILPETGGELHFNLLREWLRDCNETHSDHGMACNADNELPTRVLDVGDVENQIQPRLYRPKKDEKGRYIALSHCWGESQLISTKTASIEAHYEAIKWNDLPKTFQDAVVVTGKLGIRFLWIDSLCIIQDDPDDWLREAKCMEKVFASAYCTIAASSAKNSTEGFLIPRPVKQAVRLADNVYACEVGQNFDHDIESAVLNQRGWVLQERALSPRTIHFTATQTYWECGSVIRCENLIQMAK
jgi:Heterokaryon incompatibility protein (HET)